MQSSFDAGERFEIGKQLGAGSFGTVYEAFDRQRNRPVALKVLERALPDTLARFKREFRSLSELRHPNLASMYELLVVGERWILSMERIVGKDLLEHLAIAEMQQTFFDQTLPVARERRLPIAISEASGPSPKPSAVYLERVLDYFGQLAAGIAALHAHGIVHRDVKPSNIMITPEGRVVLLDFGLATKISFDDSIDRANVVGTPGYMSPEQMRGATPSAASDWFSFGALLFQALTGSMPFTGQSPLEILDAQLNRPAPSAAALVPGVSEELDRFCRCLMAPDPAQRPEDAAVLGRLGVVPAVPRFSREFDRPEHFVGRTRELRRLLDELSALPPGEPRVVLLHGLAGSGRSAMIGEFLGRARTESDALIMAGICRPWESVPLNAIDTLIDSLARRLRHHPSAKVDAVLSRSVAVTRLFPVLGNHSPMPVGDETVMLPPSGERLLARAAAELSAAVAAAAAGRPVLITLDDVQWATAESARMLLRLLDGLAAERVLVVLSCRTENREATPFPQMLRSERQALEILLHDLPLSTARRLSPAAAAKAAGNPALMRMIAAERAPSLAAAVEARLARVSADARALYAALLRAGRPLGEEEAVHGLELIDFDEPVRTLTRERLARLIRTDEGQAVDVYHPRMRRERNDLDHAGVDPLVFPSPTPRGAFV